MNRPGAGSRTRRIVVLPLASVMLAAGAAAVDAQVVQDDPVALRGIDVEERLGDTIPLDLPFISGQGDSVALGAYFQPERPVVLILGYYTCPMLCNLVFNGFTAAAADLPWTPGREYQVVTVSIDPRDTDLIARAKRDNYREALGKPGMSHRGWDFLTGSSAPSEALADAVGFRYYFDTDQDQYAHPAVITILSPSGQISRYLYGIAFKPRDLRLALVEAADGKIGTTVDRLILACFHYDPDAAGYVLFAGGLMRVGGAAVLVILFALLVRLWWRERQRRPALLPPGPGVQGLP